MLPKGSNTCQALREQSDVRNGGAKDNELKRAEGGLVQRQQALNAAGCPWQVSAEFLTGNPHGLGQLVRRTG